MTKIFMCSECKKEFRKPAQIPYIDDVGTYEGCPYCKSDDIECGEVDD